MAKVKLGNDAISMARLQPANRLGNRRGEIMEGKMGISWVTVEGNVAKGPFIVPFWIATGITSRSPLPLSNFLSLLFSNIGNRNKT